MESTLSIQEAAKLLGKNPQFVRVGLQQGRLPFGAAVKTRDAIGKKPARWSYVISRKQLMDWLGKEE